MAIIKIKREIIEPPESHCLVCKKETSEEEGKVCAKCFEKGKVEVHFDYFMKEKV